MISPDPIRAGEWKSLRAPGALERYLELARRRAADRILVMLDLEDDCSATEAAQAQERIANWKNGREIAVSMVFAVKEYESIFLACVDDIVEDPSLTVDDPESYRDAKGRLKDLTGRRYKETQDQEAYTKAINLINLFQRSRWFRKFVKELSELPYKSLAEKFT